MMRTWLFGALCMLLFAPLPLPACSCGPAGPACAYASRAAAIFIGTVAFTDHDAALGLRQRTLVKFRVEEAFKGLSPETREVWVDPGSFTSCYAEYPVGERFLVFAYGGQLSMPPDTPMMSVNPGEATQKPLPSGIDPIKPPVVYVAAECSGTRKIKTDVRDRLGDMEYLRAYKAGTARSLVRGRVVEDADFGIFEPPGLRGVKVTLTGNGINKSTQTDANGDYVFDDVPAGLYTVVPFLKPYVAQAQALETQVPHDGCGAANFNMVAPGVIEGTLLNDSGQPATRVRVEVLRIDGQGKPIYYAQKEILTGSDGRYRFDDLPSGDFQVGVNLFRPPDPKTPYEPTKWSGVAAPSIHLFAGERKQISPFRLPPPAAVRNIEAQVRWPDGSPAAGVSVWGEIGDHAAALAKTDTNGLASIDLLEGIAYSIEAKIWLARKLPAPA